MKGVTIERTKGWPELEHVKNALSTATKLTSGRYAFLFGDLLVSFLFHAFKELHN